MSLPSAKKMLLAGGKLKEQSTDTLPAMTANNAPSGHVASTSGSSVGSESSFAYRVFSKDDTTVPDFFFQSPNTGWIQRQTPIAIRVWRFGIRNRDGSNNQSLKDFSLYGSNDGTNFTLLRSVTGQTDWASLEERFFDVPKANRARYLYHRLTIEANNGSPAAALNELYLLQEKRG